MEQIEATMRVPQLQKIAQLGSARISVKGAKKLRDITLVHW